MALSSNHAGVLEAADLSGPLYSEGEPTDVAPLAIQIAVRPAAHDPGPPSEDLFDAIQYVGDRDWLAMHIGGWGHVFVRMGTGEAIVVVTPELAARPDLVSRCVLNTILNNLLTGCGFGMLHATGLVRGDRVLLLMAPHGAGKSTTALRLGLRGYRFVSDSQVYVSPAGGELQLFGFPVGRLHLREDVVPAFPELRAFLTGRVRVRGDTKLVLDLRQALPDAVEERVLHVGSTDVCLLRRGVGSATTLEPASHDDVMEAVMRNSIHYDDADAWRRNLEPIVRLMDVARHHHLVIGSDAAGIVAAVNRLG